MRTASTLVAVLGLFFCLAGVFAIQSHGGASMSTTSNSSSGSAPVAASRDQATNATASVLAATPSQHSSPNAIATRIVATSTSTQVNPTPTPMSTQQTYENTPSSAPPSSPQVPAALDLGQPGGRLLVGGTLIVLGLLGVIVTHLFERSTHR
jgi:cytoskeletal protein RodZ